MGADDYITKPFDEEELIARIEAVIRRGNKQSVEISFNGLTLNLDSHQLFYQEKEISLTPKDFWIDESFSKQSK